MNSINQARLLNLLRRYRGEPNSTLSYMRAWFEHQTTLRPNVDKWGNFWLWVGEPATVTTMWTAHTDTVDSYDLVNTSKLKKSLTVTDEGLVTLNKAHKNTANLARCLGADDGAGCEALASLAEAGVPGLYVWFAEEESGGYGSLKWTESPPTDMGRIQRCISIDRRGYGDVVINQIGSMCASLEAGRWLSNSLAGVTKTPWVITSGVFTDSANLKDDIAECVNISCGYEHEHTENEYLDLNVLNDLVEALKEIDLTLMPTKRDPSPQTQPQPEAPVVGNFGGFGVTPQEASWLVSNESEIVAKVLHDWGLLDELIEEVEEQKRKEKAYDIQYTTSGWYF